MFLPVSSVMSHMPTKVVNWCLSGVHGAETDPTITLFGHEAWFISVGTWTLRNPILIHRVLLHDKVGVWCATSMWDYLADFFSETTNTHQNLHLFSATVNQFTMQAVLHSVLSNSTRTYTYFQQQWISLQCKQFYTLFWVFWWHNNKQEASGLVHQIWTHTIFTCETHTSIKCMVIKLEFWQEIFSMCLQVYGQNFDMQWRYLLSGMCVCIRWK